MVGDYDDGELDTTVDIHTHELMEKKAIIMICFKI